MSAIEYVRKRIRDAFPFLKVTIYPDPTQGNIIVAIDSDFYDSSEYLDLILDIKMNYLWKNGIFNFLFVNETLFPELAENIIMAEMA
jgi:hypothetical protein